MPQIAVATRTTASPTGAASKTPLRNILKDATAANHARLDARLSTLNLHELVGYRRFLEANAAAVLPLESALVTAGVQDILPGWQRHERSHAIVNDLARIGGSSKPLDSPLLSGRFAVLGVLYVLEGSRLGAAYLLKRIRRCADPLVLDATAFLSHGATQHLWQDFIAALESSADNLINEQHLIEPARRAFDLFERAATQS